MGDAPKAWKETFVKVMEDLGFTEVKNAPSVFYHEERRITIANHVDDPLIQTFSIEDEEWILSSLEKAFKTNGRTYLTPSSDIDYLSVRLSLDEQGVARLDDVGAPLVDVALAVDEQVARQQRPRQVVRLVHRVRLAPRERRHDALRREAVVPLLVELVREEERHQVGDVLVDDGLVDGLELSRGRRGRRAGQRLRRDQRERGHPGKVCVGS